MKGNVMDEIVTTPLMQKNVNDLTVGDTLKLTLVITVAMAAIPVGVAVVGTAWQRIAAFRANRKNDNPEL
jgi:hypothetical protein